MRTFHWKRTARKELFSIDRRALGVFRILLGSILLFDLVFRYRSLLAFYTDEGVLPAAVVLEKLLPAWNLCLHCRTGSLSFVSALFLFHAGLSLLFIFGIGGRVITALNFLMLASLQQRNPLILFEGDSLLCAAFFWAMFLPLHDRYVYGKKPLDSDSAYFAPAGVVYLLQLFFFALLAYFGKNGTAWQNGSAVFLSLYNDSAATSLAVDFRSFLGPFSRFLSRLTLIVEFCCPLLWFFPYYNDRVRTAAVFTLSLKALLFASILVLNLTPFVEIVILLPLLPRAFWDSVLPEKIETPAVEGKNENRAFRVLPILTLVFLVFLALNDRLSAESRILPNFLPRFSEAFSLPKPVRFLEPEPPRDGGWYVIRGLSEAGVETSPITGELVPPEWGRPRYVTLVPPDSRWVRYYASLWQKRYSRLRFFLGQYLCQEWNAVHEIGMRLESLEIFYKYSRPEFSYDRGRTEPIPLFRGKCGLSSDDEE